MKKAIVYAFTAVTGWGASAMTSLATAIALKIDPMDPQKHPGPLGNAVVGFNIISSFMIAPLILISPVILIVAYFTDALPPWRHMAYMIGGPAVGGPLILASGL